MKMIILVCGASLLWAGTTPRALPAEYPVQAVLPRATIAAEYGSRAISQPNDSYHVGNYLVVEVAIFPEKGLTMPVSAGEFRLRMNQSTRELSAQSPGLVAAAIRNPGWEQYRGVQASGGVGPGGVVVGGPPRVERFPGDPQGRRPTQPRAPEQNAGRPGPTQSAAEAVEKYALEEGPASGARSGLLYFYWEGKVRNLKAIYLVYDGAAGRAVLKLR
ncbi:MAG TPA: hypothetical protein VGK29_27420 [Paludibaculum sp.]